MSNDNNNNFNSLLKSLSEKLGTSPEELKKAAESGDLSDTLKNMNSSDAQKVQKVLSDKEAAKKLLSTPKAKELLKKFLGGK